MDVSKILGALISQADYQVSKMKPIDTGKHVRGKKKAKNWREKKKIKKLIARKSQKINRRK